MYIPLFILFIIAIIVANHMDKQQDAIDDLNSKLDDLIDDDYEEFN